MARYARTLELRQGLAPKKDCIPRLTFLRTECNNQRYDVFISTHVEHQLVVLYPVNADVRR